MSTPQSILDAQTQTLLDLVEQYRREQCERILTAAREQHDAILAEAHREARERVHQAAQSEREHAQKQLDATRARLQTRARQQQHQTALLMLHQGWDLLGHAVLHRWKSVPQRTEWVYSLLTQGMQLLPACQWTIDHPPGWEAIECDRLLPALRDHCGELPRFRADPTLHAGLRLWAEGACLDGSLEGLLADRQAIEAELLAQLNRLLSSATAEAPPA